MHGYESDNFFRGPKIYFALGATAIAAVGAIRPLLSLPPLAGFIDAAAMSAGAAYAGLIWLYDRWGWRWLSTLPDLRGTWVGQISSSHDDATAVLGVMRVRQTWTRMSVELETTVSRSLTTMAALYEDQPGDTGLKYEFISEPRNQAADTMHVHRGVCRLALSPDRSALSGGYFTGRGRKTHGDIAMRRVSRGLLNYDTALMHNNE